MDNLPLVIYALGGLGVGHRVFKYLEVDAKMIPVEWIDPLANEDISSYAKRVSNQIDTKQRFGIIGVSFGGIVAIELNQYIQPLFTVLISSAATSSELPWFRSISGGMNIFKYLPKFFLKPPLFLLNYMFGAKNIKLLKEIIKETDPLFLRWALGEILRWKSHKKISNLHLLHGSKDKIIPWVNKSAIVIKEGGHFMVVDNATEVSKHLNEVIRKYLKTEL